MSFTKLSDRFSNAKEKEAGYRDLPLSIVWYQWMLTERSLNQKWYPVLPNLLILFLQMALRGHPRMMLRSRSARGVSVRIDGVWQHRGPKTVREATRGESRRMSLSTAINGASTSTTFLCQIARSAVPDSDASSKNIPSAFDAASQTLRLSISKLNRLSYRKNVIRIM